VPDGSVPHAVPPLGSEDSVHPFGCTIEHRRREVGVDVCRRGQRRVAEDAAHHPEILARFDRQGGEGVTQIVEPLAGESETR
jgi:hypothetical protein